MKSRGFIMQFLIGSAMKGRASQWELNATVIATVFSSAEMDGGHNSAGAGGEREVVAEEESPKQSVCKRCKETYAASANSSTSCCFHPSFFVCRRHDDQRRYYELGPNDPPYAAKFYDCCGAENQDAPGCTTSFHISYDD